MIPFTETTNKNMEFKQGMPQNGLLLVVQTVSVQQGNKLTHTKIQRNNTKNN